MTEEELIAKVKEYSRKYWKEAEEDPNASKDDIEDAVTYQGYIEDISTIPELISYIRLLSCKGEEINTLITALTSG